MNNDSSWHKQREEFDDLVNLWDQALQSGIFDSVEKQARPTSDFFGNSKVEDPGLDSNDANYWNSVVSRSGEMFPDESMMLMEAAKKKANAKKMAKAAKKKKSHMLSADEGKPLNDLVKTTFEKDKKLTNGKKATLVGNEPNKVGPDTVGSDSRLKVSAGLASHPNFKKIEDVKKKLYNAETEMSDRDGLSDKKIAALEKKFEDLRTMLDKLSNELHGKYADNEYYN
jgi:hypothetical protein